ncbi:MAG: acetate/propionate family kinase [Cellulomonas sp.]
MSSLVLVINSGSSSIKYQLVDADSGDALAGGIIERIGQPMGAIKHDGLDGRTKLEEPVANHEAGLAKILELFATHGPQLEASKLTAIGHRVVQGGTQFTGPTLIDDDVEKAIEEWSTLAPLHNPPNLDGIRAARAAFGGVPHVAVFDTSFHTTLPAAAYTYAIDRTVAADYSLRRYGAHGTSHQYVSRTTAELMGRDPIGFNVIVLHLGNGASATAVRDGKSVETSMGLTPLEGLVMGTRSGDLDPALLIHLGRVAGKSLDELDALLNRESGMLGLCGFSDMRDVHAAVEAGNEDATTALEVYYHRIKGYVGNYYAQLGRVDAIAFTAGIGEKDGAVRAGALAGLEGLGIEIDPVRNAIRTDDARIISTDASKVTVWVVPTNEELEIARESVKVVTA